MYTIFRKKKKNKAIYASKFNPHMSKKSHLDENVTFQIENSDHRHKLIHTYVHDELLPKLSDSFLLHLKSKSNFKLGTNLNLKVKSLDNVNIVFDIGSDKT